jgi:hypothetical protein
LARKNQQEGEVTPEEVPGGVVATLQKKTARNRVEDDQGSLLAKKPPARRSAKSAAASDDVVAVDSPTERSPSEEGELDHIASDNMAVAMEGLGAETSQPGSTDEPPCCPRLLSDVDRLDLDRKYGRLGTPIALDVLIGKVASQQMVMLENLFFHTARVFKFQLEDKKFFVNLAQDLSGNNGGRISVVLSCGKGNAQVFLESLDGLSAFAPELSKFSIDSYPAPVQQMLLNSLLSPLLDRLSTMLSAKVSAQLAEGPQSSPGTQFPLSVRVYDGNPYEGKEVGLLLFARITMDLSLAEEIGKFIQQVPTAILRTFPIPFRYENRIAETGISREDLASLRLGDVILLDNSAAVEAKQTRLIGPGPYGFTCTGNGNKLSITGIGGTSA